MNGHIEQQNDILINENVEISQMANLLEHLDSSSSIGSTSEPISVEEQPEASNSVVTTEITPSIFNLSSYTLSKDDIELLNNGLKFLSLIHI